MNMCSVFLCLYLKALWAHCLPQRDLIDGSQRLLETWVSLLVVEGQWMEKGGYRRNCLALTSREPLPSMEKGYITID